MDFTDLIERLVSNLKAVLAVKLATLLLGTRLGNPLQIDRVSTDLLSQRVSFIA